MVVEQKSYDPVRECWHVQHAQDTENSASSSSSRISAILFSSVVSVAMG